MARRHARQSGLELFISLPWWVSVLTGAFLYAVLRFAIPAATHAQPLLAAIGNGVQPLASLVLGLFLLCALISGVRGALAANRKSAAGAVPTRPAPASRFRFPGMSASPSPGPADADLADEPLLPNPGATTLFVPSRRHAWNVEALRSLEWKRFEMLCGWYYESFGLHVVMQDAGADGGVDLRVHASRDAAQPMALGQCKAWQQPVGVAPVRELRGVMAHENVERGLFLTTSSFTDDAKAFASENRIQLIDGEGFAAKLLALDASRQQDLLRRAFSGDFSTPTCPSCGVKMLPRNSVRQAFWGCVNFPRCRSTLPRAAH